MEVLRSILLLFGLVSGSILSAQGQVTRIQIDLQVDGKSQPLGKGMLLLAGDTLRATDQKPFFEVSDGLYGKKGTVWVACGTAKLRFIAIPVVWNRQVPKWTFGVDTVPFDKQQFWGKIPRKAHTAYFLENSIGVVYHYFE